MKQSNQMDIKYKSVMLGTMNPNSSQRRIVYNKEYLCPTLQAAMGEGGGQVPMILVNKDEYKN